MGREREVEMELENFIPPCPRCPFRPEYGLAAPPEGILRLGERRWNVTEIRLTDSWTKWKEGT